MKTPSNARPLNRLPSSHRSRLPRLLAVALSLAGLTGVQATSRIFTYSYEPEAMPKGAREFEQWITLRAGRTDAVGKDRYVRWDIREEFEYGVTDWYTAALNPRRRSRAAGPGRGGTDDRPR